MSDLKRVRQELRTNSTGFQAGWVKNPDGTQGERLEVVSCSNTCACGPGCAGCPAVLEARHGKLGKAQCYTEALYRPFSWRKPKNVFLAPVGDLFHPEIPDKHIFRTFAMVESCPQHGFILATKREMRMYELLADPRFPLWVHEAGVELFGDLYQDHGDGWGKNLVLGVSVEDQAHMYRSLVLPDLPPQVTKAILAAPMLGPLTVQNSVMRSVGWVVCNPERGSAWTKPRPCKDEWQVGLRDACRDSGIPFYWLRRHHPSWVEKYGRSIEFPACMKVEL